MPTAKSYLKYAVVGEPYEVSKRMYVKVDTGKGLKQVRWYTDKEYAKMYPEDKPTVSAITLKPQKEVLGFEKGYITIFKGNVSAHEEWFRNSVCRYCRWWGWYLISTEELPSDLPKGLEPIQLFWENVSDDGLTVSLNETKIKQHIDVLIYGGSSSEHVGHLKDRLDLTLTVTKAEANEGRYGITVAHTFEDADGNVFFWNTSAQCLDVGETYKLRGTIKDHTQVKGTKVTVLTRCTML